MYDKFEKLCKSKGVTPYRVAQETKVSTATLSNWKKGTYTPKTEKLQILADYFDVPLSFFLESEVPNKYNAYEHVKLISLYEKLSEEERKSIINIMEKMVQW